MNKRIISVALAALMLVSGLAASGCAAAAQPEAVPDAVVSPAEPEIVYENVPEEYRDLFHGGSFDEDNIWVTDDGQYAALVEKLRAHCDRYCNGSILVATDDKVVFAGGWDAKETDGVTTVNPFTTYEIGSVTKQFCAVAILQQVQAGKIDVTQTIDRYFPDYPYGSQVTVEQLLRMDSGIRDFMNDPVMGSFFQNSDFMTGEMTDEEQLKIIGEYDLSFAAAGSEDYMYSNTNYWLLALILEQVTGQPYEDYIRQNIFDVCNMPNSSACAYSDLTSAPEMGSEYSAEGRCCRGAGDIHSNVCDILRWDRALLNGQKLLDEERMEYMLDFRNGYSCGWVDEGDGNIGHSGGTRGYASYNSVYKTSDGENLYLIQMTGHRGKSLYSFESAFEIIEKYMP